MYQLTFATPDFDNSVVTLADVVIYEGYSEEAASKNFRHTGFFDRDYSQQERSATRRNLISLIINIIR